jgi:hypothetical protein
MSSSLSSAPVRRCQLAAGQLQRAAAAAADEERWVRSLHRHGLGPVVGDRVVLAGKAERLAAEQPIQDGDRFGQPRLPHRGRVEGHADRVVLRLVPTGADRDVQPAAGQDVDARQVLGEHGGCRRSLFMTNAATRSSDVAAATVAMATAGES